MKFLTTAQLLDFVSVMFGDGKLMVVAFNEHSTICSAFILLSHLIWKGKEGKLEWLSLF